VISDIAVGHGIASRFDGLARNSADQEGTVPSACGDRWQKV